MTPHSAPVWERYGCILWVQPLVKLCSCRSRSTVLWYNVILNCVIMALYRIIKLCITDSSETESLVRGKWTNNEYKITLFQCLPYMISVNYKLCKTNYHSMEWILILEHRLIFCTHCWKLRRSPTPIYMKSMCGYLFNICLTGNT